MDKISFFEKEYTYIQNTKYREDLKKLVNLLPDYFFEVEAASTGKYHPEFALGKGGLVRHTKSAVRIAHELLNNKVIGNQFSPQQKDLMLMALVLHDGLKSGLEKQKYTQVEHPLLVSTYISDNKDKLTLTDEEIRFICECIESHMGEYNTDFHGVEVLPLPNNKYQKFVHMCDYLSSRKFLNIKFENNDIVE